MSNWRRALTHLFAARFKRRRWFPDATLSRIADAIAEGERRHGGEIVFAVESRWSIGDALSALTVRERAEQAFAQLRAWDTRDNCGVLIYALLAERRIELVADRGIAARVPHARWQAIVDDLGVRFAAGDPADGVLAAVAAVTGLLAEHFPPLPDDFNELPDEPIIL